MNYYQIRTAFFKVLKDIFIGATIEGDSGYVNLMKIKSKYYKSFETKLSQDIDTEFQEIKAKDEAKLYILEHLYTFFNKYFSESGSIFFAQTRFKDKINEKVYQNDKDVSLFWKTHMLYYVKTDRLYKDFLIEDENGIIQYFFSVQNLPLKQNNERKDLVFEFDNIETIEEEAETKEIIIKINFNVKYAEKGNKTKTDEILKTLIKQEKKCKIITEKDLEQKFSIFKKQTEVDFFINKDAKKFLSEQLSMYINNYLLEDDTIFEVIKLNQIKTIKKIGIKIINIVSQFEDELVKIWNKPKFAHSSNYVITLDKIKDENLLDKIISHKNINKQIEEWIQLGFFESINIENIREQKNKFLPIDTKYFKDIELDILMTFDDLDKQIDGWLIHSENYQALKTIENKFKEKIQTIYIDPPYNTKNEEFIYKDNYRHASWLSLMENRMIISRNFLKDTGSIFVSIDDNEVSNLKNLLEDIFGEDNFISQLIWEKNFAPKNDSRLFSNSHEYVYLFSKKKNDFILIPLERTEKHNKDYKNPDNDSRGLWSSGSMLATTFSEKYVFGIEKPNKSVVFPPKGRCWRYSATKVEELINNNRVWFGEEGKNVPRIKRFLNELKEGVVPMTILKNTDFGNGQDASSQIKKMFNNAGAFNFSKPIKLISKLLYFSSQKNSFILDYFAGSGTTAHATIELNKKDDGERKYILVEMGKHFQDVIIPRLKKVCFSDKWKEGKAQEKGEGVSQFFKYFSLEQYEEVLKKVVYEDKSPMVGDIYQQYIFMKDLKLSSVIAEIDDSEERVAIDLTKLHSKIDIAETLSHSRGKFIKQITAEKVVFEDGEELFFADLSHKDVKKLVFW